ncbi:VOC family protein [Deinococcus koreensis]|uniref:VOC family protein n=1 Tax=Deinococcus koreensis TaxID=2054903 RepID=A0A2K3UWQ8_9DEIO|nr:VOC family protein [Deinococcus koreensis]PNY80968.1 VOC family protein [Deinococcus koreensis]
MPQTITPFLMFEGRAEEALTLYTSLFEGGEVLSMERYGPGEPGPEGSVRLAEAVLGGLRLRVSDSPVRHAFSFTPSVSLFVDCESEEDLRGLHAGLSAGGAELMPLGEYGFSRLFGWVNDRFGVSWQLNLPHGETP